jgi:hypothetical protein
MHGIGCPDIFPFSFDEKVIFSQQREKAITADSEAGIGIFPPQHEQELARADPGLPLANGFDFSHKKSVAESFPIKALPTLIKCLPADTG